jgi:hypothetical protein
VRDGREQHGGGRGELERLYVKNRVRVVKRLSEKIEMWCEPSVVHMPWLGTCEAFTDTMQNYGVVHTGVDSWHSSGHW